MKLYDLELSANSYRVRLLLSLLDLKCEVVTVNLMKGENREPWFLELNPRGQVPALDDGGTAPYVAHASEGEIPLDPYAAVRCRIERNKALPGFVGMPGI